MRALKTALVAVAALGGALLGTASAAPMPVGGLAAAAKELSGDLQNVRWVCGWYRCWWRPAFYYAYRPLYYRPVVVYAYPVYPVYAYPAYGWGWRRWWW
jgi:hypothetical protein